MSLYNGSSTTADSKPISVILPAISSIIQESKTLEPQMVQLRSPNRSVVYLDSTKCIDIQNGTYRLSTAQTYNQSVTPLIINARRVAFKRITMTYNLNNIFSGNDNFIFTVFKTGDPTGGYTLSLNLIETLDEIPYTASQYATLLETQMNEAISVSCPVGYPTVTVTPDTNPNIDFLTFTLGDSNNKWVAINPNCNFITQRLNIMSLINNVYPAIIGSFPILFIYNYSFDPYIDITSAALTQNSKMQSSTNSYSSNDIIHRINNIRFGTFGYTEINLDWINLNYDTLIDTIDLTFIDQNGNAMSRIDPLYFRFYIELLVEK
jgi:hypothetical protein